MNVKVPLISIIVPVYNVEKYLDQCIDSIVNQTYDNLEIILVDDESPDNSPQMCEKWAKRDSRIKVIHEKNGGLASARNAGLDMATGEYIGFVDSDDYISKDMYSCMLQAMKKTNAKIACCKSLTVRDDDLPSFSTVSSTNDVRFFDVRETIEEVFSFKMGTSFWRRLFHASVLENIRFPEGEINEDYPLLIPTVAKAGGTVLVDKILYYYRDRSDSVTGTLHTSIGTLKCVKRNLEILKCQLSEYKIDVTESFSLFSAKNSFFMILSIVKNYDNISGALKELYESYLCTARKNKKAFLKAKNISMKDKLLYILILFKIKIRRSNKKGS